MSRRILLADDSVTIQKVIELTFMDDDYEVRAVGNGDEALAMLTALTVDFVIADVHMPGASGYEVCRRSKQLRPEVPVLLLVGTFEPFDEAQARESGADSYLKKPFDSQELLGRVHELLGPAAAAAGGSHPEGVTAAPATPATPATSAIGAAAGAPEPAAGASGGPAGAGAGTAQGIRLTSGIEAASTWQEFELEEEPELVADPWPDVPPPSPAAAARVPPAVQPYEQPFALGELDEHAAAAEPAMPAGQPSAAPATRAPTSPEAAGERFDRPFTLGGQLDDRVLLDQAEAQEEEEREAAPAVSASADAQALRATQEEPVSRFGAAPSVSRPAAEPRPSPQTATLPETPATAETSATPVTAAIIERAGAPLAQDALPSSAGETGDTEQADQRVAAEGNGQPAAQLAADVAGAALGDQDVDRIARRVVELIGDKVVRDIAWEVIPDLAEVVIKDRLRELESQIE